MRSAHRLLATLALVAATGLPCPARAAGGAAQKTLDTRAVCIRGTCFEAEVAVTAAERARGLMHRTSLAPERGMLFVFPEEGVHRFWMKNTLIELDIVFIGANGRIVSIAARARPCRKDPCDRYAPEGSAAYALEIAGGLAAKHGFAKGDTVLFR